MAEVLLFHHAQGLTAGIEGFADTLRGAGHTVSVPDLFGGRTFDTVGEGVGYAEEIGFETILQHGREIADELPAGLVYVGFSLGVMPAQQLAQTRDGAKGALLVSSCLPVSEFGASWPSGVPVQIHGMDADPIFVDEGDLEAARELVDAAPDDAELCVYPGSAHLFMDSSLQAYDPAAAALLEERALAFLDRIG